MDSAQERRVRDAYAAFARGDIDSALSHFVPDATFTNPDYAIEPGVREGREAVRESFQALHEGFDYASLEVEELVEGPDGLLVLVRMVAHGRGSGAPLEASFVHVFRFRGEQVSDFAWFRTAEEGRRAVGLA
jgi:ketosteroid isomerase-like protein